MLPAANSQKPSCLETFAGTALDDIIGATGIITGRIAKILLKRWNTALAVKALNHKEDFRVAADSDRHRTSNRLLLNSSDFHATSMQRK